jgi:hypothetical protein
MRALIKEKAGNRNKNREKLYLWNLQVASKNKNKMEAFVVAYQQRR